MLSAEKKQLVQEALQCLAATHAASVMQIEEQMSVLVVALDLDATDLGGKRTANRPVVNRSTFSVDWHGRSCFLGNTLLFRMFERLARFPGSYVSQNDLLDDVWDGERQASTIRGVAKRLRDRLAAADMADLARAIDGSVSGYYGLILV